ncbi:DUF4900 domain-containing protein [Deinococcus sp. VB343]|uniref:DUF4900 domain-containing protein n=1 Tax=Deinococcus sp. VB142 TaxID=3112952 RepID=A0AAU6Q4A9_9DEIO
MKRDTTQGIALVTVMLITVLMLGIFAVTFQLSLGNISQSRTTTQTAQTLALSQGARNLGYAIISDPVGNTLGNTITRMANADQIGNASTWVFAPGDTGTVPQAATVASRLSTLASNLQGAMTGGGCYGPYTISDNQTVSVRITFTGVIPACDGAAQETVSLGVGRFLSGSRDNTQTYTLPYVMVVSAKQGNAQRTITTNGEYQFDVGNGSFARYALLTDVHQGGTSASIFFTERTLFNGPVHTNGNFAFRGNSWFGGAVTSSGTTDRGTPGAHFIGTVQTRLRSAFLTPSQLNPPAYGDTQPTFNAGVDWNAQNIPFPTSATSQLTAAQQSGLVISDNPANIELSVVTYNGVKYQRIKVGTKTYFSPENGGLYVSTTGAPQNMTAATNTNGQAITRFNGVIYAQSEVRSVKGPARTLASDPSTAPPAVASFSQMTLASPNNIRITGDLKYETNPCDGNLRRGSDGNVIVPTCNQDPSQVRNVLGIYSSGGNVRLGYNNADSTLNVPKDVQIHSTLMAYNEVNVENHNTGNCSKGTAYILGGVISRKYGAFGTFDRTSGNCSTGLGRSFTYDQRMLQGLAPPSFPTTQMTSLLANRRTIQFNQTEQTRR